MLSPRTRDVAACGLQLTLAARDTGTAALIAVLRQRREGDRTRIEWCARRAAGDGAGAVSLEVPGIGGLSVAVPAGAADTARREYCREVPDASTLLFQRVFVSGGVLVVDRALLAGAGGAAQAQGGGSAREGSRERAAPGAGTLSLPLQRPLPVEVSRAYLNCAGDLFRPADDR
jgi:hypothetical protein